MKKRRLQVVWKKLWTKIKENWIALTALLASVFTFIFCRNRRTGLSDSQQLCSDIRDRITETQQSITDSKSEVESVRTDIDRLADEAKTAGSIIRKYGSGNNTTN